MRNFFSRFDGATWPQGQRLHGYVLPDDRLRAAAARYQQSLVAINADSVGLQLPEYLHFTVQMLRVHRDEITADDLDALIEQLRLELTQVEPFTLTVGPPQPSDHAIELWVEPTADPDWQNLVNHFRTGCFHILDEACMPPLGSNRTPHTSISYGIGAGDSGSLASALKTVRHPLVEVPVNEVHLAAVDQHPSEGYYSWIPVTTIPLGPQR